MAKQNSENPTENSTAEIDAEQATQRSADNRDGKPRRWWSIALWLVVTLILLAGAAVLAEIVLPPKFANANLALNQKLKIPEALEPEIIDGKKIFNLEIQEGETEFFEGKMTKTLGANGTYLMPTLRASNGDDVQINIKNSLSSMTTIHWHGMHLPPTEDGVHQIIEPQEVWQPTWVFKQQAAPLWYHPHLHGHTGEQAYKGLAGMFILDDENSRSLDLPNRYGIDDVPVVVQDRLFADDGQFIYNNTDSDSYGHKGMLGDTILVNGTYAPYHETPEGWVRLRILNGSNSRRYNLGFDDERNFYQIASDGGFLERPLERNRMLLAPGERAEILVDMSDKAITTLMSYPIERGFEPLVSLIDRVTNSGRDYKQQFKILELRPTLASLAHQSFPEVLNTIPEVDTSLVANTREFVLGFEMTINDETMIIDRIDEVIQLGDTEIWEVSNQSGSYHPFHIHDIQFRVIDRNGEPPAAHNAGWKDTVLVEHEETVRLLVEFKDYANPNVPYMYHCHILEHEDRGMMGQFVVIDGDQVPEVKSELLDLVKAGIISNESHH